MDDTFGLNEVFEDVSYGEKLLNVIRRKGTQETTSTSSPISIPRGLYDPEKRPLVDDGVDKTDECSDDESDVDSV